MAISLIVDTSADLTVLAPAVARQLVGIVEPTPTQTMAAGVGGMLPIHELAVDLVLFSSTG